MVICKRLSLKYYANTRAGEVISRVINDVEQTKNFVMTGLMNLWLDLATIINCDSRHVCNGCEADTCFAYCFAILRISVKYFFGRLRSLTRNGHRLWLVFKVIYMSVLPV